MSKLNDDAVRSLLEPPQHISQRLAMRPTSTSNCYPPVNRCCSQVWICACTGIINADMSSTSQVLQLASATTINTSSRL